MRRTRVARAEPAVETRVAFAAALACIISARLVGAHDFQLFDRQGAGINIVAMRGQCHVTGRDAAALVHSNHCLEPDTIARCRPHAPASQASSEARPARR